MKELVRLPAFWVGVSVSVVVLVSLVGLILFPNQVKVVSPALMVAGLGMVLWGASRRGG